MTPDEFNNLNLDDRGAHTFNHGTYFKPLDLYSKRSKVLYMVYGMIVEVIVNKDTNKIEDIQAWKEIEIA